MYIIEKSQIANLNAGEEVIMKFLGVEFSVYFEYVEDGLYHLGLTRKYPGQDGLAEPIIEIKLNDKEYFALERHMANHSDSAIGDIGAVITRKVMGDILSFFLQNLGNYVPGSFQFDDNYYKKNWEYYVKYLIHEIMEGREVRPIIPDELKNIFDRKYVSEECPICGGSLVVRQGRHGNFLGCSNYPDCKYTTDL